MSPPDQINFLKANFLHSLNELEALPLGTRLNFLQWLYRVSHERTTAWVASHQHRASRAVIPFTAPASTSPLVPLAIDRCTQSRTRRQVVNTLRPDHGVRSVGDDLKNAVDIEDKRSGSDGPTLPEVVKGALDDITKQSESFTGLFEQTTLREIALLDLQDQKDMLLLILDAASESCQSYILQSLAACCLLKRFKSSKHKSEKGFAGTYELRSSMIITNLRKAKVIEKLETLHPGSGALAGISPKVTKFRILDKHNDLQFFIQSVKERFKELIEHLSSFNEVLDAFAVLIGGALDKRQSNEKHVEETDTTTLDKRQSNEKYVEETDTTTLDKWQSNEKHVEETDTTTLDRRQPDEEYVEEMDTVQSDGEEDGAKDMHGQELKDGDDHDKIGAKRRSDTEQDEGLGQSKRRRLPLVTNAVAEVHAQHSTLPHVSHLEMGSSSLSTLEAVGRQSPLTVASDVRHIRVAQQPHPEVLAPSHHVESEEALFETDDSGSGDDAENIFDSQDVVVLRYPKGENAGIVDKNVNAMISCSTHTPNMPDVYLLEPMFYDPDYDDFITIS